MIDSKKRSSLKILGTISASLAAFTTPAIAATSRLLNNHKTTSNPIVGSQTTVSLTPVFKIQTLHSQTTDSTEISIFNTTGRAATITHITPGVIEMIQGEYNFDQLLIDGPLTIPTGESVTVQITKQPRNTFSESKRIMTTSLTNTLQDNLRIETTTLDQAPVVAHVLLAHTHRYT